MKKHECPQCGQDLRLPPLSMAAKAREFWVLLRSRQVLSVNWGSYAPDSVYGPENLTPKKGDKVIRVQEVAAAVSDDKESGK
jgi:hypothetical protein